MRGTASGPTPTWTMAMALTGDLAFLPIGYPVTDPFCYQLNRPPNISSFPPATFYSDTLYVSPTAPGYFLSSRPYVAFTKPQHLHTLFLSSPAGDPQLQPNCPLPAHACLRDVPACPLSPYGGSFSLPGMILLLTDVGSRAVLRAEQKAHLLR